MMSFSRKKSKQMELIMADKKKGSGKVGYGKPPAEHQFKPGQSGNWNGRRKGSKNTYTLLQEILDQKISVSDNGKQIKISKKIAMLTQLVNKGVQGDIKAISSLLPHMLVVDMKEEDKDKALAVLNIDDKKIIENYLSRFDGVKGLEDDNSTNSKGGNS